MTDVEILIIITIGYVAMALARTVYCNVELRLSLRDSTAQGFLWPLTFLVWLKGYCSTLDVHIKYILRKKKK